MLQFAKVLALAEQVAGRVHATAEADPVDALRHRGFIAAHLVLGVAPFAFVPALLAFGLAPQGPGFAAFAWPIAPILIALGLSRTGDLARACLQSAVAFAGLAAIVAAMTGGLFSLATPWLALPLIEAALSGSRRAIRDAAIVALMAVAGLTGLWLSGVALGAPLGPLGGMIAALYAVTLAIRAAALIGAGERSDRDARALAQLFAGSVRDLVTRHAASGAATFVSPAAQTLLGVSARELMEHGLLARVHIADRPAYLRTLAGAAGEAEPVAVEIRLRAEPGLGHAPRFVWAEMRARRLQGDGAGAGVVAVFRDVTDRKAHEEELVAARVEADRASLAKTRFLANMSHELRTPLNAIIGFSEILSDEQLCRLAPERRADYAALIHKSGAHLLEVVNSILDMAKIESGAFAILAEPCEIEPVVGHCVSLMALKAEAAGVRLSAHVAPDAPMIQADRRALTQILLNLVANAIKFTPRDGEVDVEVQARAGAIALIVRDTGVGIAPEHIARLGEAFFQADSSHRRRHEGSGLGLSVVRGLVALHRGEMTVESTLGHGTRVAVVLPLDCREPGSKHAAPSVSAPPDTSAMVRLRA